jgi:hypothetical protein
VTISWLASYGHPLVVLWAAFIAVLVAAGAHREPRLLLAVIPAALIHGVLHLLGVSGSFTSSESSLFGQVFAPLAIALACVLVLAPQFGQQRRWLALLASASILVSIGIVSGLAYNFGGTEIGKDGRMSLVFYLIVSGSVFTGMVMAFLRPGGRRPGVGFAVRLLVVTFILTVVGILVFGCYDYRPRNPDGFMEILMVGLVVACCVCGVTLPFLVLLCIRGFLRRRIEDLLGAATSSQRFRKEA